MNAAPAGTADNRIRVLFVDDEPRILEGIVRSMRTQRARVEVLTANGGPAGLELLERTTIDMVISDMRMPIMDGAAFLAAVRQRHPQVMRIILSGQGDKDTIVSATRVAHQFLSKPSDLQALCATIDRYRWLGDLVADPRMRAHLAALEGLPSAPGVRDALPAAFAGDDGPATAMAMIGSDPGLAAKILQATSTSFFGTPHDILTPREAARRLGGDVLRTLLDAGCFPGPFSAGEPWLALAATVQRTARLAQRFAQLVDATMIPVAESAGLLHRCGDMALAGYEPRPGPDERAAAGAFLLGIWGLPDPMVEAVARHRRPRTLPGRHDLPTAIVHAACALQPNDEGIALDEAFLADVGLAGHLARWREVAGAAT